MMAAPSPKGRCRRSPGSSLTARLDSRCSASAAFASAACGAPGLLLGVDAGAQRGLDLLGHGGLLVHDAGDRVGRVGVQRGVSGRLGGGWLLLGHVLWRPQGRVGALGVRLAMLGDGLDGHLGLLRSG